PARQVVPISLLSFVFSNNVGLFGLSGGAVRLRHYTSRGLSAGEVVKLVAFSTTGFWMGLLTVAGIMFTLEPLPVPEVLSLFLLAQVVALVSHVPGGLGVFETVMVLLLQPDVPPDLALGSLLVYRVAYYLVPLVLGAVAMGGWELFQRRHVVRPLGRLYA